MFMMNKKKKRIMTKKVFTNIVFHCFDRSVHKLNFIKNNTYKRRQCKGIYNF